MKLNGICGVPNGQSLFDGYCFQMTSSEVDAYPSISIELGGNQSIIIPNNQYLFQQSGYYCMGVSQGKRFKPF